MPGTEYLYRVVAVDCDNDEEGASLSSDPVLLRIQVQDPWFSIESGEYGVPQEVEISCSTTNSEIYYTTDGSDPDDNSQLYTGPFMIDESTIVKAIAYLGNNYPSGIVNLQVDITTGLPINQAPEFSIFPNPAGDEITLSVAGGLSGDINLMIYDISGRILMQKRNIEGKQNVIDISSLSQGYYFVKISDSYGNTSVKRLIKY
ncbi:MAG: FN3 associated domain-containing protein [Bacteroidales bacterium]